MSVINKDFVVKSGIAVRGTATVTTTTQATVGGSYLAGGLAVNKNLLVGTDATIYGQTTVQNVNAQIVTATNLTVNGTANITGNSSLASLTATAATFNGNVDISGSNTFTVGSGTSTFAGQVSITDTTAASSTLSAAFTVVGGAGIGGDLYIGGEIIAQKLTIQLTTVTTTEITTDDIITTQNNSNAIGTDTGAITAVGGIGIGKDIYVGGKATILGTTTVTNITAASSTNSGAIVVYGGAGIGGNLYVGGTIYGTINGTITTATNLAGGAGGSLPYQTSDGVTTFLNIGTNGYVLTSNGSAPSWQPVSGLSAGNATTATNIAGGEANYIPYQTSPGNTTFSHKLQFNGSQFTTIKVAVTGTDASSDVNSGALTVDGGVGINGDVYIGQTLNVTGQTNLAAVSAGTTTATSITVSGSGTLDVGTGTTTLGGTLNVTGQSSLGPLTAGITTATSLYVNGLITSGITQAQTTGTVVPALFSNNVLLSSFTSNSITGTGTVNLDSFTAADYRSVRYFIQIYDNPLVQITEMTVFHDSTDVFIIEYGTGASSTELGSFSATLGGGTVTLTFTPDPSATNMKIKLVRMALTS